MGDDIKPNYYSIIPATVRYDKRLKYSERILYGEITSLTNINGYCFAGNKYFANLYGVSQTTISKWISHLEKCGYIRVIINRDNSNQVISRHIYIEDVPYCQKNQYPYCSNKQYPYQSEGQYPIEQNSKDNIINNNNNNFININKKNNKIPLEFYSILENLEFLYPEEILYTLQLKNLIMLSNITQTLYIIYNSQFRILLYKMTRNEVVNIYIECYNNEKVNIISYYRKALINKYTDKGE